jgi:hypothetical protein
MVTQEFPNNSYSPKVPKSHPLIPILSQISVVHTAPFYLSKSMLMLSSHLLLGLHSGLFRSGFPSSIQYAFMLSPMRATRPVHFILLDFIIIFGEEYKSWSFSLCCFLQPPVTLSLFHPNILLNILFSNTLSLCSFLNVRDQVSHPYRTTSKIIVLYILIIMSVDEKTKAHGLNGRKYYPNSVSS